MRTIGQTSTNVNTIEAMQQQIGSIQTELGTFKTQLNTMDSRMETKLDTMSSSMAEIVRLMRSNRDEFGTAYV